MKLGLSSYTYGWAVGVRGYEPAKPMDEHGLLDQVREHGLKLLQIGDNLPLHAFSSDRLKTLADCAKIDGIELEIGARGLTPSNLATYAGIARVVGAKLIRFVIDDTNYHPSLDSVVTILRDCRSAYVGLLIGLENHDRFKACEFRQIVDSVETNNVGICLDTANSLGAGEGLETVVSVLGPITVNLHIKDFRIKRLPHLMGFTVSGCPAGVGLVDIPSLLGLLNQFGRCRTGVLEQWATPEPNIEQTIAKEHDWALQSLAHLKPLF